MADTTPTRCPDCAGLKGLPKIIDVGGKPRECSHPFHSEQAPVIDFQTHSAVSKPKTVEIPVELPPQPDAICPHCEATPIEVLFNEVSFPNGRKAYMFYCAKCLKLVPIGMQPVQSLRRSRCHLCLLSRSNMRDQYKDSMRLAQDVADLDFYVPLIPPSVNHYVKHTRTGRHYVTAEAKAFKAAIPICAKQKQVRYKFYAIEIYVTLGPKKKADLDNCSKVILDGLVEGGQIHSDAAVTLLCLHKKRGPESRTCITVWEGKPP